MPFNCEFAVLTIMVNIAVRGRSTYIPTSSYLIKKIAVETRGLVSSWIASKAREFDCDGLLDLICCAGSL